MSLSSVPPEVLEKLRRCLAMTKDRGAWENEAAIAMKIANSIMEKYGLDRAEVEMEADGQHIKKGGIRQSYSKPYWMAPWEKELAVVPELLLPVELIFSPTYDNHIRLMFVGTPADGALAIEVYKILRAELLKISREEPNGASRRSFLLGCAEILRYRAADIRNARKKAEKEASGGAVVDPGFALVVVKSNDVKLWVKEHIKTKPVHNRGPQDFDDIAYGRGQEAGKHISLNFGNAIGGGAK